MLGGNSKHKKPEQMNMHLTGFLVKLGIKESSIFIDLKKNQNLKPWLKQAI